MIKKLLFLVCIGLPIIGSSQVTFTDSSTLLVNQSLTSGCPIGVTDMNNDGRDDIIRLDDARDLEIEYQNEDGSFTQYSFGAVGGSQWGLCIADVDENGYNDIFTGGAYNGLKVITANVDGTSYSSTTLSQTSSGESDRIFLQNVNFSDIDNDGDIDIFACHDDGLSPIYTNDGSGNLTKTTALLNPASTNSGGNDGNYGSIWADYDNDGDQDLYISKCRLGETDINDGSRVNLLFQNNSGVFTDIAQTIGLAPLRQSWSANFEDIDNDGDLDCILINHDLTSQILENNGSGIFNDITAASGIATELSNLGSGGIQVMMEDFDNDSFIDLFITSRYTSNKHIMFKNNGDKTFSVMSGAINAGSLSVQSAAVGDLNNDGFIDVLAGFATGYNSPSGNADRLYLNNGNSNNWGKVRLQGVTSNINGIGARIELYTALGMQIREVRSGESYGTMNSLETHFGIASETAITKIVVRWPSGLADELINPGINQSHLIIEGSNPLSIDSFVASNFNIYPNPARDSVTITTDISEDMSLIMYDISGKLILSKDATFNNQTEINISALQNGVYFMHITSGNNKYVHKLIKE